MHIGKTAQTFWFRGWGDTKISTVAFQFPLAFWNTFVSDSPNDCAYLISIPREGACKGKTNCKEEPLSLTLQEPWGRDSRGNMHSLISGCCWVSWTKTWLWTQQTNAQKDYSTYCSLIGCYSNYSNLSCLMIGCSSAFPHDWWSLYSLFRKKPLGESHFVYKGASTATPPLESSWWLFLAFRESDLAHYPVCVKILHCPAII